MKFMRIVKSLALASLTLLAGCSNIFAPRANARDPVVNGTGTVRIDIEGAGSASRTLLPTAMMGFIKYDLLFEDQAEQLPVVSVSDYTSNDEAILPYGTWTVTVSAFLPSGGSGHRLAALGEATVSVVYGTTSEPVPVTLRPIDTTATDTGNGIFAWDISFPVLTESVTLMITQLNGAVFQTLSLKGPYSNGTLSPEGGRSQGSIPLPAGSYYAQTLLTSGGETNPPKARRRDALFILEGMTTTADAVAGYTFANDNFYNAIYVTSAGDSGPGTLRQAIADAVDGDTIQVTLPPGSVIALDSQLIINYEHKVLTIEGNGVTIARGAGMNSSDQLLRVMENDDIVIRRIHFKGREGSLDASAVNVGYTTLVLESCIFSDNGSQSTNGGAVYNRGGSLLTILGCTFYNNKALYGSVVYNSSETSVLRLGGNLFYGNTANSGGNVVYRSDGTVTSLGCNVSEFAGGDNPATGSGFVFKTTDKQDTTGAVAPLSLKPVLGSGALGAVNVAAFNGDNPGLAYPSQDFYGNAIPSGAANAGAVQGGGTGYALTVITEGLGQVTGIPFDAEGLVAPGASFTLTASPTAANVYLFSLTVDGAAQAGNTFAVTNMNKNLEVLAVFGYPTPVANEGEFLQALANPECVVISLSNDITLTARATITRRVLIEGNGATITSSGMAESNTSQFLSVNGAGINVIIRRVHFKGGRATGYAAAIRHYNGTLALESCIFSDNQANGASAYGGAVYIAGVASSVTISGCTFYGNKAGTTGGSGGAVYKVNGTLTLRGNLFWKNTAASYSVVYGSPVSEGYNITDRPSGTGTTESGWEFDTNDDRGLTQAVYPGDFKPLFTGAAYQAIDTRPFDYPTVDFYGDEIPAENAMSGAVQATTTTTGYGLNYATRGSNGGVTVKSLPDALGMYSGNVTLEATGAGVFNHWIVDGAIQPDQSPPREITVSMDDGSKTVTAVFAFLVTSGDNAGPGTLRQAVNDAISGDVIMLQGQTITLTATLRIEDKSLTIEGNGATLTQSGIPNGSNPLLFLPGIGEEVRISRLLFTGGYSGNNGAAINSYANLTLESCIFSDNTTNSTANDPRGGAINTYGPLTVLGCTFTSNAITASSIRPGVGAAIALGGATLYQLSLTGNIFQGNTSSGTHPVVYPLSTPVATGGYNISDYPSGTGGAESGWVFNQSPADVPLTDVTFDSEYKPTSATSLNIIQSLPASFPITYFDGTLRGSNSAPGAMPPQSSP
jgi:hypothetical protein